LNALLSQVRLQTSALHALVLLARPLGGREGAVHTGRAPSLPALQGPLGGIVSVLECMARHLSQSPIQAMGCWAMVNFSLQPDYKAQLLQEKALPLILRALQTHASHQEVQFRGLFALINFVVPDEPPQAKDEFVEVMWIDDHLKIQSYTDLFPSHISRMLLKLSSCISIPTRLLLLVIPIPSHTCPPLFAPLCPCLLHLLLMPAPFKMLSLFVRTW